MHIRSACPAGMHCVCSSNAVVHLSNISGSTIVLQLTSAICFGVCVCYLRLSGLRLLPAGDSHMDGMCTGE